MPKSWIIALNNYAKHNGFENRSEVIRNLFYPAFLKELRLLDPEVKIEPIINPKKVIKKPSLPRGINDIVVSRNRVPKRFSAFRNFTISDRAVISNMRGSTLRSMPLPISVPSVPRNLGYRKPKRKKEKKPSVPRRLPKVFIWK
jgi:hypothetical protein